MIIKKVKYKPALSATRYIALSICDNFATITPDGTQFLLTIFTPNDVREIGRRFSIKQCYKTLRSL